MAGQALPERGIASSLLHDHNGTFNHVVDYQLRTYGWRVMLCLASSLAGHIIKLM
jgi:hypothetical protein